MSINLTVLDVKVSTADFRNGMVLNLDGILYAITVQHVKPGKGPAFVRTKLKGIVNRKILIKHGVLAKKQKLCH